MRADLSLAEARRLALAAQGFHRPRPGRVDARRLARALGELGALQLDFVNVLAPAHYLAPFARLGPYDRTQLDELVRSGGFTEQWAHEASILPVDAWPLLAERRRVHRVQPWGFERFLQRHPEYVAWVLEEVRESGPLSAADLPIPAGVTRRIGADWRTSVPRAVLEFHFGRGRLASAGRLPNFARRYDLVERRLPDAVRARVVEPAEAERELLRRAARAHGVGTAGDLADYFRMPVRATRARLAELCEAGELEQTRVEGWREVAFRHPAVRMPRRVDACALLSPFDSLVWCRPRLERLFGFEYRVEIYVPAARRRFGYYVLPFLLGDRLVARVDLKADRAAGVLRVPGAWLEPHADRDRVCAALARELSGLAAWLGLQRVVVGRRGDLARALGALLRG